MTSIYVMTDPRTNEAKYIGKTRQSLDTRLKGHLSVTEPFPVTVWTKQLQREGYVPNIMEVESGLSDSEWAEAEYFWIAYFNFVGAKLLNRIGNHAIAPKTKYHESRARTKEYRRMLHTDWDAAREQGRKEARKQPRATIDTSVASSSEAKVLDALVSIIGERNMAISNFERLSKIIGMSANTVRVARNRLLERDFVRLYGPHIYIINPRIVCVGKGRERERIFEDYYLAGVIRSNRNNYFPNSAE